jgi:hypothetical protein
MPRTVAATLVLAVVSAFALADKIVLTDGRSFTGTVTVESDTVIITVPYGTLRFPREQVERIEFKDTPEQEYAKRLADLSLQDANAVYALAEWADDNSLSDRSGELLAQVLRLNPNHAAAHRRLGHVRLDRKWMRFDEGLELARGKLDAGLYTTLLDDIIPELKQVARSGGKLLEVEELLAMTQLRAGHFAIAAKAFTALGAANHPLAARCAGIAEVLAANADGMYILREAWPPTARLMSGSLPSIQPGPASLSNPRVLEAALHEQARKRVEAGQKIVEEAQKLEPADPDAASAKYALALKVFDGADALCRDISRLNRLAVARRKIAAVRKDADGDAKLFDDAMKKLGQKDMTPQAYRQMLQRLLHSLDSTRDGLKRILEIARAYPDDLFLEVKWAELDLTKTESMRRILTAELDGKK